MPDILQTEFEQLKKKYRRVIWIVLLLLLALLGLYFFQRGRSTQGHTPEEVAAMLHALDSVSNQAKTFENANGKLVTDNVALVAKNEGLLHDMSQTVFNLKTDQERLVKEVRYLTLIKQQVRYDSVFLRYDTSQPVPLIAEGRSDSIAVPVSFHRVDTSAGVFGRVTRSGVFLDSVWVNNNIWLRHGVRKRGFLNLGSEDFVQAMNTNPMVRTTGLGTVTYRQRPTAWNRWIKPTLTAGVAAGLTYWIVK
ncbi:MAG: hypothetical protein JST06_09785 [Bacteroidetes bacterium]|nr:hypothetical protein [Bacteroidota bacterium]MBS1628495.1 hypothetical protein [Bacteroidota bacterium]